jgi:hypothetical protein
MQSVWVVVAGWNQTSAHELWVFSTRENAEAHLRDGCGWFDWSEMKEHTIDEAV